MEILVSRKKLFNSLNLIQGVISKRDTLPILNNVLFKAKKDNLKIIVTDLETMIKRKLKIKVIEEGDITISVKQLINALRGLEGIEIRIKTVEGNFVEINCGNQIYSLPSLEADDFPAFPEIKNSKDLFIVKSDLLLEALDKTMFAVSTDDERHNLQGVYFEQTKNCNLRMISTDGFRLNKIQIKSIEVSELEDGIILPTDGLKNLKRILNKYPDEEVSVSLIKDINSISFKIGKFIIIIKIIDGQFPEYKQIIPKDKEDEKIIIIKRKELISVLQRLKKIYYFAGFVFTANKLSLSVKDPESQVQAKESMEIKYQGEEFKISFMCKYLLDFLEIVNAEKIILKVFNLNPPDVVILKEKSNDLKYTYFLMPFKVRE